ncbi:hypothetical protein ACFC1T_14460 [Kitasatospora sp. NPDC056076]|uniref:hypothetical protein n=1 Tax=Kitasatospora sp. NPDC056076 TaxID=3345703 RepID=UPI0035D77F1E
MITDPLTVSVDGHLDPVTAPALEALARLWETVRQLPISEYELRAMGWLLNAGNTADLERMMAGSGTVDWPLSLGGGQNAIVRASHGDGLTPAQRVGARYVPEQHNSPQWRGGQMPWVIRDCLDDDIVLEDGRPLLFDTKADADAWRLRQVQLASYRRGPAWLAAE